MFTFKRFERAAAGVLAAVAVAMLIPQLVEIVVRWNEAAPLLALDYNVLMSATRSWLGGGSFYPPAELAGRFGAVGPMVMYPPPLLVFLVPFAVMPPLLWWLIPIAVTAWAVWRHRPRALALGVILLCLVNPTTLEILFLGNSAMFFAAAIALGTHFGWPAVLVFLKPTLAPFALIGVWRKSWWLALGALAITSALFLPLWFDYLTVIRNVELPNGPLYSIAQVPLMLLPIAAWLGRTRPVSVVGPAPASLSVPVPASS